MLNLRHSFALALAALTLSGCTSAFSGPVEVTRFVAENRSPLGQGTITLEFPEEMSNRSARDAFAAAIADELSAIGYRVVLDGTAPPQQIATVRTSREPIAEARSRGPVNVGVGAGTGTFGSGVGLGVGIDLGGGKSAPSAVTELSVRISGLDGASLWEGRATQAISIDSPYADVNASAAALSAALFRDFPGGNGDTVTIPVDQLQDTQ